jgi:DNA adenine methylase
VTLEPRPFLKWAGGKRQLLPEFRPFYPDGFAHYHEPFLGSGAVFFDLWNLGKLERARATLTDENGDLIGCYLRVRDSTSQVIDELSRLAEGHVRAGRDHYYGVRDRLFNPARRKWRAAGGSAGDYPPALAATLIYLNRTGYNGLFRLNADGEFNVPPGSYEHPRILDVDRLRIAAAALSAPTVEIRQATFDEVQHEASAGDFVYLDPPYAPLSKTAQFRSYTSRGFSDDDQKRLQELVIALANRDIGVMLSNSTARVVTSLYEKNRATRKVGLRAYRVPARRAINSRATGRGAVEELLVTNLPRRS